MTPPPGQRSQRAPPALPSAFAAPSFSTLSNLSLSFSERPSDMSQDITFVDVVDAQDAMMALPPSRLRTKKTKWNDLKAQAASGDDVVTWMLEHGLVASRSAASELARALVRAGALVPTFKVTSADCAFNAAPGSLYVHRGLTCLHEQGLNSGVVYPGKKRLAEEVLKDLNAAFARVIHVSVSVDGHFVNYAAVRGSVGWRETLVLLSELAICDDADMESVDDNVKKACLFNLYNVLIFHAKLVFGHPMDLVKRGKFFNDAAYIVAGKKITSVELEHDVLRRRMEEGDPRVGWRLAKKDPRMHFILNCGAQSCPPLVALETDRTEGMLAEATEKFIEKNCEVDLENGKVTLSRLWKWFRYDFTPGVDNDNELVKWIADRASATKRAELAELTRTDYKVKFAVYNWADNGDGNAKPDIRFMGIYDLSFAKTA